MPTTTPNFLRFTAICCFLTVLTTLGIHAFFPAPPSDFEQRALLFRDFNYLLNRWWIIVHCLLAIVAMWGFALVQMRRAAGFTGLGFLFFALFGVTEIARQMVVLFYLNPLRVRYVEATDSVMKASLKMGLEQFGLVSSTFFGVFILAFSLGNLCYGLSLFREKGFSKVLSWLLILWSLGSFTALGNSFWHNASIETFIEYYNSSFQPLMRGLMGYWLWQKAKEL